MSARPPVAPALVQVRRMLPVPPDQAFRAWTDPELLREWFKPLGGASAGIEMDLRVGGRYRWGMRLPGHTYWAVGEFVEVDPPKRLAFTFGWEHAIVSLADSLVTVEFHAHGAHTDLVLTHERLGTRFLRGLHAWGWRGLLKDLARRLAQRRATP